MTTESLEYTNEQRKNGEGCDVWIVVDGMKIGGHKAVLSKKSLYFRNMLSTNMMEANMDEVTISGYDYETMDMVIGYMYGDKIEITTENGQSIILLANYMQLSDLVDRCAQFIIRQIDQTNCLSMKMLLKSTNCDNKLISKTDDYMNAYFVPLSKHESFIELDIEDVTELLSSDKLYVESEIDVCEGVIRWLNEKKERSEYCQRILKCIRLSLLPSDYLSTTLSTYPLFRYNPNCQRMIEEVVTNRLTSGHEIVLHKLRECHDVPSLLVRYTALWEKEQMKNSFDVYDTKTNEWKRWMTPKLTTCEACFVCHKRDIYVIDTTRNCSGFLSFGKQNCDTGVYTTLSRMPGSLMNLSAVIVGDKLYVSGSYYPTILNIFDIKTEEWSNKRISTSNPKQDPSIAAIGKYIYMCNSDTFGSLNPTRVERFDTETMKWEYIAPMRHGKPHCAAVSHRGKLYVIGIGSFEVYDPETNKWSQLSKNNRHFDNIVLAATFDGIYLMRRCGERMEHYNVEKDEWTDLTPHGYTFGRNFLFALPIKPHEL